MYGSLFTFYGNYCTGVRRFPTVVVQFLYGRAPYGCLFAFYGSYCTGVCRFSTVVLIREILASLRALDTGLSDFYTDARRTGVCLIFTGALVREFAGFPRVL